MERKEMEDHFLSFFVRISYIFLSYQKTKEEKNKGFPFCSLSFLKFETKGSIWEQVIQKTNRRKTKTSKKH